MPQQKHNKSQKNDISETRAKEIALDLYIADYEHGKAFCLEISGHYDELGEKAKKLGIDPDKYCEFVFTYGLAAAMRGRGTPIEITFGKTPELEVEEAKEIALKVMMNRGVNTGPEELQRRVKRVSQMLGISLEEAEDFIMVYQVVRPIGQASKSRQTSLYRSGGRIADTIR